MRTAFLFCTLLSLALAAADEWTPKLSMSLKTMPHGPTEPKFLQNIMEQHLEWAAKYLN